VVGAGTLQLEVRRTMLDAGGYWRPLAAVARLLEELAELAELLERPEAPAEELAGELADLWIITTALADQFLIDVADPAAAAPDPSDAPYAPYATNARDAPVTAAALMIAAGPIGRVVNYYDGPKTPRAGDQLPSLTGAVTAFHHQLELLCGELSIDLAAAVRAKLAVIRGRDLKRFARGEYDPSTAAVLALMPGPREMKLWGSPELDRAATAAEQARALAPSLRAFDRAAVPEGLDGYVIRAPAPPGSTALDAWLEKLLEALGEIELGGALARLAPDGNVLEIDVLAAPEGTALVLLGRSGAGGVPAGPGGDRP
jgi:NTP pyrophosphatase (non-canonical NTP hydrolase)